MWELDSKESWAPKNWCFWTVVLEKTLESPLDCKEIRPIHPKGDESWVFIGRTDAETLILWPLDGKSWLIGKDPDAGKDWGQEEKGTTEDEMVGWHHRLNGHGFMWTPGVSDGQGGLAFCGSWGSQRVRHDWATELNDKQWHHSTHPFVCLHLQSGLKPSHCFGHSAFGTCSFHAFRQCLNDTTKCEGSSQISGPAYSLQMNDSEGGVPRPPLLFSSLRHQWAHLQGLAPQRPCSNNFPGRDRSDSPSPTIMSLPNPCPM